MKTQLRVYLWSSAKSELHFSLLALGYSKANALPIIPDPDPTRVPLVDVTAIFPNGMEIKISNRFFLNEIPN